MKRYCLYDKYIVHHERCDFMSILNNPVNFRDLGGKRGFGGKIVKSKKLLRSGQIVGLSSQEKAILLDEYKLKNIIDFRDESEVVRTPDDALVGTKYYHINVMKDTKLKAVNMDNVKDHLHPSEMRQFMLDVYKEIILNETSHKAYRQFLLLLLEENDGSSLFHCFAGKDRTGIAAAIVLNILGISKEVIMKDYLLTNEQRKVANEQIINDLQKKGFSLEAQESFMIALNVEKEYLQNAFDIASKEYGSFDNYIKEALGFSVDEQEHMRNLYLQ